MLLVHARWRMLAHVGHFDMLLAHVTCAMARVVHFDMRQEHVHSNGLGSDKWPAKYRPCARIGILHFGGYIITQLE
jgi:hypothetical protein